MHAHHLFISFHVHEIVTSSKHKNIKREPRVITTLQFLCFMGELLVLIARGGYTQVTPSFARTN